MVTGGLLYLLDTNIVTYVVTGRSERAREQYSSAKAAGRISISAITEAELRYGLAKKPEATRLRAYVTEFLARTDHHSWDTQAAMAYSELRAKTERAGMAFGELDLLIAAHASALNATLVTHDVVLQRLSDFVDVADWATDV